MKLLGAAYRGSVDCESLSVEGDVRLLDVHFDNPEPLEGQEQPLLCFAGASVRGDCEWRDVSLSDATAVIFAGARVGTLLDEVSSWPLPGLLDLRGLHYENLAEIQPLPQSRLAWLERQSREHFSVQPFEELIAWARRNGHERAAVRIAIAREDARRLTGQLDFVQSVWNRFLGVTMAHGYAPFRVLYAALFVVLAGWGVFAYSSVHGVMVPSKLQEGVTVLPVAYPAFSPFMYSLDTFVPIIDFYQESYWLPSTHSALGQAVMRYLWFHIAMGWAVSSLAVIGFSGLVRRE